MGNIINLLRGKGEAFTLKYFGLGDLGTANSAKVVIENYDIIKEYFSSKEIYEINTMDDYVDYLFTQKIINMEEIIPYLEKGAELVSSICEFCLNESKKYTKGCLIRYLNQNIGNVFDSAQVKNFFGIKDVTLELCCKYASGLNEEVFEFLIDNQTYALLHNYDTFQRIIEGNSKLKTSFFERITNEDILMHSPKAVTDALIVFSGSKKKNERLFNVVVEKVVIYGEQLVTELCEENIIYLDRPIKIIYSFLVAIKNPKANDFKGYVENAENLMNEYIKKEGHEFKYEYSLDGVKELLESDEPWIIKVLALTHSYDSQNKKANAALNFAPKENSAIDLITTTNIPTNDYFTMTHQQALEIFVDCVGQIFFKILSKPEYFTEMMTAYAQILNLILEKLHCEEKDLVKDFELLAKMLCNYFHSHIPEEEREIKTALCYAPAMYCCALIEKVLRIVYIALKRKDLFIPTNKTTIRNLLSDNNVVINEILGEYQTKHLRFYLSIDDDDIGFNFRNRLAHWNDITSVYLTNRLLCQLFYLLASVIGSVYFFVMEKPEETRIENEENSTVMT